MVMLAVEINYFTYQWVASSANGAWTIPGAFRDWTTLRMSLGQRAYVDSDIKA
jgi:hypothetical protein